MIYKYINDEGLNYLWGKVKSYMSGAISGKANTADLATVATSGSYTDLIDAPQYVICTLSEYNTMISHDANTYYIIIADNNA